MGVCNRSFNYFYSNLTNFMKFTIYSKNGCPYCNKIQQVLQLANLEHVVYQLGIDFEREGFYSQFGEGSTFPQVVLNDLENIGGCSNTIQYLKENNLI